MPWIASLVSQQQFASCAWSALVFCIFATVSALIACQVLVRAEEYAREEKQKEEENPLLALLAADKVTTHDIMRNCRLLGYNSNTFALMSHDDIDPEFWNKLMEEFSKCKY